jgi:cysteine-rich repeat protein
MSGSPARLLLSLAIFFSTFALGAESALAQCNATQLCAPAANPCEITAACTVPAGATFDIGNRALVIKASKTLTIGAGDLPLTITAGSILLEPGAKIIATGVTGTFGTGGNLTLMSHSTITVQSQGTSRAKISVSGFFEAGFAELVADGNIAFNGSIDANSASADGFGGAIDFTSTNGSVTVDGMGLEAIGGNRGENGASGGEVVIFAHGNITVNSPLNASNGDCIACDVTLDSATGNVITNQVLNVGASGDLGDGGTVNLSAEGTVTVNGAVLGAARGAGGVEDGEAGTGGDADVFGALGVQINAPFTFDGSAPDGDGGTIDVSSLGPVGIAGALSVQTGASFGFGGEIFVLGSDDVTNTALIDAGGGFGGGLIEITSDEHKVTVNGELNVDADLGNPFGTFGGNIDVQGCDVELMQGKRITVLGGGAFPRATATIEASGQMTIRGEIRAGAAVQLKHRGLAPIITGTATFSPAPTITQDNTLPCCLNCAQCGNGTLETPEQCDDGNTAGGDCCSATCTYEAGFSPCTTDNNVCTVDLCNGTGVCLHAAGNAGATCRASAGVCDLPETCTGLSPTCPADAKSTALCRAAAGDCDLAESCNGVSNTCPADAVKPAATTCRSANGACDVAEACNGSSAQCPADGFASSSTPCRAAAGTCDVAENCTGSSPVCPADLKRTTECRGVAGDCDIAESCDGVSNDCPADGFATSAVTCRDAAGDCDVAESCTGGSAACPTDQKRTGECRAAASVCDVAESCNGVSNDCPADGVASASTPCRASAGVCDVAENCNGVSPLCPTDLKSTAACRAAAGDCDLAESCDGVDNDCPADVLATAGTVCRGAAGDCDAVETCTGSSSVCPADQKKTTSCRPAASVCDVAETCDGASNDCPADETAPDGITCDDGNACTPDETCTDGLCGGGTEIVCDACETCDESGGCVAAPQTGCFIPTEPERAQLQIKNDALALKDQVSWKWTKGEATPVGAFGDPFNTEDYALCIFDESTSTPSVLFRALADAGGVCDGKPCWKTLGTPPAHKGYKFQDKELTPDGFDQLQLKAGIAGKASITAKLKGVNLSSRPLGIPNLPVSLPLRVQLQSSNGQCWESTHSRALRNDPAQLSSKSD